MVWRRRDNQSEPLLHVECSVEPFDHLVHVLVECAGELGEVPVALFAFELRVVSIPLGAKDKQQYDNRRSLLEYPVNPLGF